MSEDASLRARRTGAHPDHAPVAARLSEAVCQWKLPACPICGERLHALPVHRPPRTGARWEAGR